MAARTSTTIVRNNPHSGSPSRAVVYCVTMVARMLYRFAVSFTSRRQAAAVSFETRWSRAVWFVQIMYGEDDGSGQAAAAEPRASPRRTVREDQGDEPRWVLLDFVSADRRCIR